MNPVLKTDELEKQLETSDPKDVERFLSDHAQDLVTDEKPFSCYIRELLRRHGKTQIEVIGAAGFSAKYGYRVLSEERHTRQRDYILRICFAGGFTLDETQRLLKLYGMSPLYARIPRDAVLISCLNARCGEILAVDRILCANGFAELKKGEETVF